MYRYGQRYLAIAVIACLVFINIPEVWGQTSNTYYVGGATGNDSNAGTSNSPWRTVQKCADTAPSGSICAIAPGIYRENVKPRQDNLTFRGSGAETIISGAEEIAPSAWQPSANGSYSTTLNWSMNRRNWEFLGNNQVFWDKQMLPEARWPNLANINYVTELTDSGAIREDNVRATAATGSGNNASYTTPSLSQLPDFSGGKISYIVGYRSMAGTCDVTNKSGSTVNFVCNPDPGSEGNRNGTTRVEGGDNPGMLSPKANNYFYLWGKKDFLDVPGEWFVDPPQNDSNASQFTLTILPPNGIDPRSSNAPRVQVKRRNYVFDLWQRSGIKIENLAIFGATVQFESTNNITIDQVDWRYPHHFQEAPTYFYNGGTIAISVKGTNNKIINSYLAHAPAGMIQLSGSNHLIENNVIQNVGYVGIGVGIGGSAPGTKIRQNTMFNAGRYWVQLEKGVDVLYNDISQSHRRISDLGAIYGWSAEGGGAQIAYNLVHDSYGEKKSSDQQYGAHGIYADDNSTGFDIHHNIMWNLTSAGLMLASYNPNSSEARQYNPGKNNLNIRVYNNTTDELDYLIRDGFMTGLEFRNNLIRRQSQPPGTPSSAGTIAYSNNFFGNPTPGLDGQFSPEVGSPLINAGQVLPPYTNGFSGAAPDIGAREFGATPFVAGAIARDSDLNQVQASCTQGSTNLNCNLTNLPPGRKVPLDFQLRVGGSNIVTNFNSQTNYQNNLTIATGTGSASTTLSAAQLKQLEVKSGSGNWVVANSQGTPPTPTPSPIPTPTPTPSPNPSSVKITRVTPEPIVAGATTTITKITKS